MISGLQGTAMHSIKLLESPIPTATTATATASSQKAHFDNISGTKRGTIDPLVSKRPDRTGPKGLQLEVGPRRGP